MKKLRLSLAIALLALGTAGCTSAFYASGSGGYSDDLYATHDRTEIARSKQAEAELARAEAEARKAQWEALLAQAEAGQAQSAYENYTFQSVLADTYESAYARRLLGFQSPTYNLPSSYYDLRYSSVWNYVTAYDPMNYNIVVMGDQVWVEPKYISSMFGTWGAPSYTMRLYWGWGWPYDFGYGSWWGYPHYSWWDWSFGWGWGPGWGPGWGWHGGLWWGAVHHPAHASTPHYPNYRPWGGQSAYRGQTTGVNRSSPYTSPRYGTSRGSASSTLYRGQTPVRSSGTASGSNSRTDNSSTVSPPRQNTDYRSGTSNYRPSGTTTRPSSSGSGNYRSSGSSGSSGSRGGGSYRR